jgi:Uma2 family endonuclease
VRLWPGKIREPDLVFMSTGHLDRIGKYWGVPDLAVEIISEGTEFQDREVKRNEYQDSPLAWQRLLHNEGFQLCVSGPSARVLLFNTPLSGSR